MVAQAYWLIGYDPVGNILSLDDQVDNAMDQTFSYDDLYRLDTADGDYGLEDFDYDANGNRERYQNGVIDDAYTYEPLSNRLAAQNGWTFTRDSAGNRTEKLDALGYGQLQSYGDHNRLSETTVRDALGDTIVGSYEYDGRGQRLVKTAGGVTVHFAYGPSGELIGEYEDDGTLIKEYIYLNNQPIAVIASETIVTGPNTEIIIDNGDPETSTVGNWNTKTNKQPYGPDYKLKNKAGVFYRWTPSLNSADYEVWAWWQQGGSKWSTLVEYNIVHNGTTDIETRSHQADGGQWNLLGTFTFDGTGAEYIEIEAANGKTSADAIKWIELDSAPTQQQVNTYFIHSDHMGTPRQVSDDLQSVVWRWDSSPFGENLPNEDPDGDFAGFELNLRFPGQYCDAETGLHYNYFRNYDASTGRYIESDPIGLRGGLNTFGYVSQNPITRFDQYGLLEDCTCRVFCLTLPVTVIVECTMLKVCESSCGESSAERKSQYYVWETRTFHIFGWFTCEDFPFELPSRSWPVPFPSPFDRPTFPVIPGEI